MYSEEYDDEEEQQSGSFLVNFYNNNKVLVWIFLGIIIFIILMSLLTKGGSSKTPVLEYNVVIEPTEEISYVNVGRTKSLIARVDDDPTGEITWSTEDETIVKVDQRGNVSGLTYGKTTVTATYIDSSGEKHFATRTVIVSDGDPNTKLIDVSFEDGDLFMPLNSTYPISLELKPSLGYVENESFTSSKTSVATVDNKGVVTAVGEGEATITFDINNSQFRKTLNVYVDRSFNRAEMVITPTNISFDGELRKIKVGTIDTLTYSVEPSNTDKDKLIWKSSDESIVTVENGKIKGISEGTAKITVSSLNGKEDKIDIEVEKDIVEVTDIDLNTSDIYLTVGQTQVIIPSVLPDNASNKSLQYTSLDESTVLVSPNGTGTQATVIGLKEGNTTIVVRPVESGSTVEKRINVTVTGSSNNNDNSNNNNNNGGGGGGNSATIVVRVNGDVPTKKCEGQELTYYNNPTVKITLNGGISKVKYCYASSYKCTPNTEITSTQSFTISGSGIYTLRIKKYDRNGDEIASSDSGNYYDDALEYYINTKAQGARCNGSSSTPSCSNSNMKLQSTCISEARGVCGSNGYTGCDTKNSNGCYSYRCKTNCPSTTGCGVYNNSSTNCRLNGCYWDGSCCVNNTSPPSPSSTPPATGTVTCPKCTYTGSKLTCFSAPSGATSVNQCTGTVPAGKQISCNSSECAVSDCSGNTYSTRKSVTYSSTLRTTCISCGSKRANATHTGCDDVVTPTTYDCKPRDGSYYKKQTSCYYTKYDNSAQLISTVNSTGLDSIIYGCVKTSGCGSSVPCYDVWRCERT